VSGINRAKCLSCHSGAVSPSLTNYSEIMSQVIASSPDSSRYYQVTGSTMPPAVSSRLSATEREVIRSWIADGAKNN
jgi:uncharacterized membrane protein